MKKIFICSIFALGAMFFNSCGNSGKETAAVDLNAPEGMRYLNISKTGMNLYVLCPDSTKGQLDTVMQSYGTFELKMGKDFQISILEGEGDIKTVKSDIANNDVNQFKRFLVDEANTLVWESAIAENPEFHFYTIQKVGNRSYVIEDIKGEPFTQAATEAMLNAAKNLREFVVEGKKES
jgi:hypothetical protein